MAQAGERPRPIVEICVVGDDDALCTPCGRLPAAHPRIRRRQDHHPHRWA